MSERGIVGRCCTPVRTSQRRVSMISFHFDIRGIGLGSYSEYLS
ncbi:hypothetical protein NJ7G_1595 [Natrinema sp. J7-2]|nr:hypothetical protein NJ7G_1595 [Natrinema sp. J7-2]